MGGDLWWDRDMSPNTFSGGPNIKCPPYIYRYAENINVVTHIFDMNYCDVSLLMAAGEKFRSDICDLCPLECTKLIPAFVSRVHC